jgi:acyl-CoA reductase-like NAD-dependent aldehyde dehydrogenase
VITGVANGMTVAQEEIFGPVLSVIRWRDLDELEQWGNGVRYGFAAGMWTRDVAKALRLADRLDVGIVWINSYGLFNVAVPFGGRKLSGYGRELGEEALDPYLKSKSSVWIDLEAAVPQSGQGIRR